MSERRRARRILVVVAHPDPTSFTHATAVAITAALEAVGHQVRTHDLYAEGFEPVLDADEHRRHLEPGVSEAIADHAVDLRWCEILMLVYPTWWSGQPAILKGWIDRVWACGVAWDLPPGANRLRPGLGNIRRIIAVTSHGSSKWVNALEGEAGKRTVTRSLRVLCHRWCRTGWWASYGLDRATPERRRAIISRWERRARRL